MKYVIFELVKKGKGDKWHSRIKSPNGKIMWAAEEYSSLWVCEKTVKAITKLMNAATYRVNMIINGKKKTIVQR